MSDPSSSQNVTVVEPASINKAENNDRITLLSNAEWTKFKSKEKRRLPRSDENLEQYLTRVKLWNTFSDATWTETRAAKIAKRAHTVYWILRDFYVSLHARAILGGRCSCTDLLAHSREHTAWPMLADFTRNADRGCVRCWFVIHSIEAFGTRFAQHDPNRIQVHIKGQSKTFLEGDFSRIRVRWLADGSIPTLQPYLAQPPEQWRQLNLELWTDEGKVVS